MDHSGSMTFSTQAQFERARQSIKREVGNGERVSIGLLVSLESMWALCIRRRSR